MSTNMDKPLPPIERPMSESGRPARPRKVSTATSMREQTSGRWPSPTRRAYSLSENTTVKESHHKGFFSKVFYGEKLHQVSYRDMVVASIDSDDEGKKISPDDIVIAVMGVTGSGKSTFIRDLTDDKVEIGNKLKSCTAVVSSHKCNQPGYENVWLIDTPGFDDTERTDAEILHEIGKYLVQASSDKIFLAGIIYLHRIQDPRIGHAAMRNIRMFKKLCGPDGLSRTTLVTTFWQGVNPEEGQQREEELLTNDDLWRVIREKGGKAFRYEHKKEGSAKVVVKHIIDSKLGSGILKFQQEMDDGTKAIIQTEAGIEVNDTMEKLKQCYQAQIEYLRKELNEAKAASSDEIMQIRKEFEEKERKLQKAIEDHELLREKKEKLKHRLRTRATKARHGECSVM